MIPEEFAKEIFSRWPYRGQRTQEELVAISEDISKFANRRTSEELEPILEEFVSMKPPKGFGMWWFYERVNKSGSNKVWWRTCENGHLYQDRGACCPECGSSTFSLTTGRTMPIETILIQESCCVCKYYNQNMTDPIDGLDGFECRKYGTEESGKLIECNQCKCRECCKIAYVYKTNSVRYRNMVGEKLQEMYKKHGLEWAMKKSKKSGVS